MTDFHSHVLPGMDDGSPNVESSVRMLKMMQAQGVEQLVATPHFYPEDEAPEAFLQRRAEAIAKLLPALAEDTYPTIFVGAEVAYYPGISRSRQLGRLCIAGTPLLLVEMPFSRWSDGVTDELYSILESRNIVPVVAHVERYIDLQKRGTLEDLTAHDILIQSNAQNFTDRSSQKAALKMLNARNIHLLGSDAHNCTSRRPDVGEAVEVLREKTDGRMLTLIDAFAKKILKNATPITELG